MKSLLRRLLISLPTMFGVSLFAFMLIRLAPGDPVQIMIGERGSDPEVYAQMRARLGLDQPLVYQYLRFMSHVVQGDFGTSVVSQRPVLEEFIDRFPATLELGMVAIFFAVLIGVPLGIVAAVKRRTWADYLLMSGALVGYSMPIFWWGLVLILFFSLQLGWFPVSGRIGFMFDLEPVTGLNLVDALLSDEKGVFFSALGHLVLPAVVLGTIPLAVIARMTRSSLLEVLKEDFIRTARAKGLKENTVIVGHALRNALIPVITVIGLMVGTILTGAILTETIFSWPGLGRWIVSSVEARDYPVIQGGLILISLIVITVNIVVDLLYQWANPMLRGHGL